MENKTRIFEIAKKTLALEAEAVSQLITYLDDDFVKVVELIFGCKGRVIVTGIGKSANIANKIVATFNSTGTPSIFMHAADAIHGDLGIIQKDDVVICLSKSGNTSEIKVLVPLIKRFDNLLVAIVSNQNSFLAKQADYVLKASVSEEACPNNLAPTSSTTAQLALGDAIAMCLLDLRGFSSEDFAKVHPGGSLGKKLYLRVKDIYPDNERPCVKLQDAVGKIISEISSKRLGATAVLDQNDKLVGMITDGDIRRMLEKNLSAVESIVAGDIMSKYPKTVTPNELAVNVFNLMKGNNITQIVVIDKGKYLGMVHLHDLIREGIV
ncbi:MAG: KpsF/GutQ family sugar-phosphate isomerase [Bacteroidales bacterium]|jgi:arabinose-5-phosphate isomerase|nr:KpsF/GutQ family sugar-phosphate isomerase [Bacteroidales bacterium]